jgi:hypothetical protein
MASMVLGDSTLEYLTSSVNAPLVAQVCEDMQDNNRSLILMKHRRHDNKMQIDWIY